MAWTPTDDFDSYTDGASISGLNGGSGFSAGWVLSGGTLTVTNTQSYDPSNSVTATSAGLGGNNAERTFTSGVTGTGQFYVAMRRSSNSSGELRWNFRNQADNDSMSVIMNASGNIVIGSTTPVTVGAYSADTWYVIRVTYDIDAGTYTAAMSSGAYGTGGTFGTESSSKSFQNTATSINYALIDFGASAGTGVTNYWDYLSPTNPFVSGPATIASINGVTASTISSLNGTTYSTISSVNGVS